MISTILVIIKAKFGVNIHKDKSKGMMNKMGQKFRLYWMGKISCKFIGKNAM